MLHFAHKYDRKYLTIGTLQGRCNREKPACKYFHPPQHLKDQLLINGRNHLALKNALAQQMQQQIIPGQMPAATMVSNNYQLKGLKVHYSWSRRYKVI